MLERVRLFCSSRRRWKTWNTLNESRHLNVHELHPRQAEGARSSTGWNASMNSGHTGQWTPPNK